MDLLNLKQKFSNDSGDHKIPVSQEEFQIIKAEALIEKIHQPSIIEKAFYIDLPHVLLKVIRTENEI